MGPLASKYPKEIPEPNLGHMTRHTVFSALLASGVLTSASHAAVIIADTFSGSVNDELDGQSATTFAQGVTSAGGSAVWGFDSNDTGLFRANGEVVYTGASTDLDRSIRLSLGSYIEDAKGTANGKFTLTATVAAPTGSDNDSSTWATVGFFSGNVDAQAMFVGNNGLATSITRRVDSGNDDFFPGPGTAGAIDVGNNVSVGTQTFTTVLDFTPAGGYDEMNNNFGTVSFSSTSSPTPTTFTYTTDQTFASVGFSLNDSALTTFSNFSLSQIPEPSGLLLTALGSLALLRRKR